MTENVDEEPQRPETDPGSAGEALMNALVIPDPKGTQQDVHPQLVVVPKFQRPHSEKWVQKNKEHGFNHTLGYGIILNEIPMKVYKERCEAEGKEPDIEVLEFAHELGVKVVYEVIVGQHRTYLAKACSVGQIPALVVKNLSPAESAVLFVQDARTTRPLTGFDIHQASLIRGEKRAHVIQDILEYRGLELVPSGLRPGKVSCIRAFEKIAGKPDTPDPDPLNWCLDVLIAAWPQAMWPDPMVQGLNLYRIDEEAQLPEPHSFGKATGARYKTTKEFVVKVQSLKKVMSSASPYAAKELWDTLSRAKSVQYLAPKQKRALPATPKRTRKSA